MKRKSNHEISYLLHINSEWYPTKCHKLWQDICNCQWLDARNGSLCHLGVWGPQFSKVFRDFRDTCEGDRLPLYDGVSKRYLLYYLRNQTICTNCAFAFILQMDDKMNCQLKVFANACVDFYNPFTKVVVIYISFMKFGNVRKSDWIS